MIPTFEISDRLAREIKNYIRIAVIIAVVLSIASILGAFTSPGDFYRSYLMGYLFWIGISLGSMAIVMMQYLTGGAWGTVTRRTLESASRTLPLLALLFIPIAVGIPHLYDWSHADLVSREYVLAHRHSYMNPTMFILRAIVYFAIWLAFTYFLNKWSLQQDAEEQMDQRVTLQKKLAAISAPGLILYVFTVTFAAIDWAESLETDWFSTMWGFLFVASQGLAAFSFVIIVLALLSRREPLSGALRESHFHDLGKLLLTFVMLWAYFAFSQLLIVWSGNLSDEIPWYLRRLATSWGWLGVMLILFQFIVPFLLLLSKPLKRNVLLLSGVVLILLGARIVDLMWIVMPGYYQHGFRLHWLNFSVPLAMGGLWIAFFLWQLQKRPLLPIRAPRLEEALTHGKR
jgi:hypothetical protein